MDFKNIISALENKVKSNVEIKEITKDIMPITISNIILPLSSFIDSIIVVNLLNLNLKLHWSLIMCTSKSSNLREQA